MEVKDWLQSEMRIVAIHPRMQRHMSRLSGDVNDENEMIQNIAGCPIFIINDLEKGDIEIGMLKDFCTKYPTWYEEELQAEKEAEDKSCQE